MGHPSCAPTSHRQTPCQKNKEHLIQQHWSALVGIQKGLNLPVPTQIGKNGFTSGRLSLLHVRSKHTKCHLFAEGITSTKAQVCQLAVGRTEAVSDPVFSASPPPPCSSAPANSKRKDWRSEVEPGSCTAAACTASQSTPATLQISLETHTHSFFVLFFSCCHSG